MSRVRSKITAALALIAAVLLGVVLYDRLQMIVWVGVTDLEVEFLVTDTITGVPVQGATVEVISEGGFYEERAPSEFSLQTDEGGIARKLCRNNRCTGWTSGLRFTDTFSVHSPWWQYRVAAMGYEPSDWAELGRSRTGAKPVPSEGRSRLTVRVPLAPLPPTDGF